MAIGDDVTEGFVSLLGINSGELSPVGATIPPEDIAWADSCLTKDPEKLDSGWTSLRETLLESLSSQNDTSPDDEIFSEGHEIEIPPSSNERTGNSNDLFNTDKTRNEEGDTRSSDGLTDRKTDDFWSQYKMKDDLVTSIRPSSNEMTGDSYNLVNTDITSNEGVDSRSNDELTDSKISDFWSRYEDDFLTSIRPSSNEMTGDTYNSVNTDTTSNEGGDPRSNEELTDRKTNYFWSRYKMEDDFLMSIRPSGNEMTGDSYKLVNTDIIGNEEGDPRSNEELTDRKTDDFWSRYKMEDVFLPTYDESSRDLGNLDSEIDLAVLASQVDQSTGEAIFTVWDLDIPPEEDELTKRLNKAIAEGSLEPTPLASDHSRAGEGSGDDSLDDLISGIADLSLSF